MTQAKYLWIVPLVVAGLVAFVGWRANLELRRVIEQEVSEDLESTLDANVTALEIWMSNQTRTVSSLAEEPHLKALALEWIEKPEAPATGRPFPNPAQQAFASEKLPERLRILGYDAAQIVGTNFVVVAELDAVRGGRGRPNAPIPQELQPPFTELFASGQPILVTPFKVPPPPPGGRRGFGRGGAQPGRGGFDPTRFTNFMARGARQGTPFDRNSSNAPPRMARFREMAMQVAAPIKDNQGVTRGALSLRIDPDAEFTRILTVASSGQSGETVAFDAEGLLISRSRFDESLKKLGMLPDRPDATSALSVHLQDPGGDLTQGFKPADTNTARPLISIVSRAIKGEPGVQLEPSRDYRGVPVVGAWRWLPNYSFGVATKVDASEAYRPLHLVRVVFIVLFLLLVLASLVIFLFTYLQVIWRRRVTEAELKVQQLGQYRLQEKIGEGGMGVVYRAHHALLRRDTALKLLPPDKADQAAVTRFEREVRLTCRLTHPNTIQVYDYGHTPEGIFYYAMEYLDGLNLGQLVERYGPQPEERVIHLLAQICDSLGEAHGLGLIHRDIKPANIFVCDRGGIPDCIKVLDFGLVKSFYEKDGQSLSGSDVGQIVGTPHFIAPETLKNPANNDARSDLYSLGALGYFLLTGSYVFNGGTIFEICQKHLTETPVSPSARAGVTIGAVLESLILSCLEKDPALRPQSARELADALRGDPCAQTWSLERRTEWWGAHREAIQKARLSSEARPFTETPPTVKITMSDRTL